MTDETKKAFEAVVLQGAAMVKDGEVYLPADYLQPVLQPLSTPMDRVVWNRTTIPSEPDPHSYSQPDTLFTCHIEGGHRLTVLDRETGWGGGGIRDVETGLRRADGGWWLASGMCDVRSAPEVKTLEDAIAWVIEHANNCRGD